MARLRDSYRCLILTPIKSGLKHLVKDIRHLAEASESPDPVLVEELVTSYEAAIADGEISPDELLGLYEDVNDVLESMQVSPELALQ